MDNIIVLQFFYDAMCFLAVDSQGNPKILGGQGQPRNHISLAGVGSQGICFPWRVMAANDCDLLGSCYIFLALWRFCCCPSLPGVHTANHTWRPAAKVIEFAWCSWWILLGGRLLRIIFLAVLLYSLPVFGCQGNSVLV